MTTIGDSLPTIPGAIPGKVEKLSPAEEKILDAYIELQRAATEFLEVNNPNDDAGLKLIAATIARFLPTDAVRGLDHIPSAVQAIALELEHTWRDHPDVMKAVAVDGVNPDLASLAPILARTLEEARASHTEPVFDFTVERDGEQVPANFPMTIAHQPDGEEEGPLIIGYKRHGEETAEQPAPAPVAAPRVDCGVQADAEVEVPVPMASTAVAAATASAVAADESVSAMGIIPPAAFYSNSKTPAPGRSKSKGKGVGKGKEKKGKGKAPDVPLPIEKATPEKKKPASRLSQAKASAEQAKLPAPDFSQGTAETSQTVGSEAASDKSEAAPETSQAVAGPSMPRTVKRKRGEEHAPEEDARLAKARKNDAKASKAAPKARKAAPKTSKPAAEPIRRSSRQRKQAADKALQASVSSGVPLA
ncbi:hypothetical protein BD626DRAFT_15121 [Schizophyllum amplum]|uniref:Uncharacterized protein n=1 Tax=Schizophyllum amplum TaxID=97359 RepID=A0A550CXS9_9AGAR|nr:hypothetical protein BD626DRAFT_15121 [Auriculariopsis ampla]